MVRGLGLGIVGVLASATIAVADGRPPATSTLHFELGSPQHVIAGMTFGLLRSDDGGAHWKWMCDRAVGYAGTYDPSYSFSPTGAIFATTFDGLTVMRDPPQGDSCTFAPAPSGSTFVSVDQIGPDGSVLYAAADPNDGKIYRSTDDGVTFPSSGAPGQNNDWWDSLVVAPSDAQRVYVTGYRFQKVCSNNTSMTCVLPADCGGSTATCDSHKLQLLYRSDNGGATWTALSQTGLTISSQSTIDVVGVDHALEDTLYIHINLEDGAQGDGIYKSSDAGSSWSKILTTNDPSGLAFLAKQDGKLVASTMTLGSQVSDGGATCMSQASCNWAALSSAPHINCLVENPSDHSVWACTRNYSTQTITGDGYGIMKTSDLSTWTGVLRFQDIDGVVTCPTTTVQYQRCVSSYNQLPSVWCCLRDQLGITDTSVDCTGVNSCGAITPPLDGAPDAAVASTPDAAAADNADAGNFPTPASKKGCCDAGGSGPGSATLALCVSLALCKRRRR